MNNNQLKPEVYGIYEKDEKITTIFKAVNDPGVTNKAYLDEKFLEMNAHI